MGSLIALLIIASVSLLLVRIGTTALMMTGLSWDTASFQAYSAFFGVGFTTSEAEMVVNHPMRRRIIRDLILAGNVGLTSALATLIVTFVGNERQSVSQVLLLIGIIAAGFVILVLIGRSRLFRDVLDNAIRRTLEHSGAVKALDYELLLRVKSGYCVSELEVTGECMLAGRELRESRPADHGVIILGIYHRDGSFKGAPHARDRIEPGDVITLYGEEHAIQAVARGEFRAASDGEGAAAQGPAAGAKIP